MTYELLLTLVSRDAIDAFLICTHSRPFASGELVPDLLRLANEVFEGGIPLFIWPGEDQFPLAFALFFVLESLG